MQVIPGESLLRVGHDPLLVFAERGHGVKGIGLVEPPGVDDGQVQVAKPCPRSGFLEHGVLAMEDRLFEGPFAGIVIDGSSWLAQKEGQPLPLAL